MDTAEPRGKTRDLLEELERLRGADCAGCRGVLEGRHALMSIAAGFKDAPLCLPCLAEELGTPSEELARRLFAYIQSNTCYRTAWAKLRGENQAQRMVAVPNEKLGTVPIFPGQAGPAPAGADASWDAGDMGCGDLVLELRLRLREIEPGQVLEVTARDPGAREDLPAWCRLTGHGLVSALHPVYRIRRKES